MQTNRVLVIGAGLAGHRVAQALRKREFAGELIVVGDEEHMPYDRPPLSKQILDGAMTHDEAFFKVDGLDDVEWRLGKKASALDTEANCVTLDDGEQLDYEALVICTGRRAREWPAPLALEGLHMLRSLDDCRSFQDAVRPDSRVAIVGAGFIGCEVAAALRKRDIDVTVIDVAPLPMSPIGPEAGRRAQRFHVERGVRFVLDAKVKGFAGNGNVSAVELEGHSDVPADLVLLAMGSVANTEWLENSGVELDRGAIVANGQLVAAGTDNVFVAGDVASFPHPLIDGRACIEHWTNAREMASLVAENLLAADSDRREFSAIPTFWSDQYDVKIKSVGFLGRADTFEVVDENPDKNALVVEAKQGDELVGAICFNRNKKMIEYTRRLNEELKP